MSKTKKKNKNEKCNNIEILVLSRVKLETVKKWQKVKKY